jgi:hypothetical protein
VRAIVGVELAVALEVQVSLRISERKDISDLRADANDPRHEGTDMITAAAVAGELVIHIANRTDKPLLGEKLRRAPIEMEVDAILIVCLRVDIVVGEARNRGEFVTVLRI